MNGIQIIELCQIEKIISFAEAVAILSTSSTQTFIYPSEWKHLDSGTITKELNSMGSSIYETHDKEIYPPRLTSVNLMANNRKLSNITLDEIFTTAQATMPGIVVPKKPPISLKYNIFNSLELIYIRYDYCIA